MIDETKLKEFDPNVAKLTELAEKYRALEIKGVDDVDGYKAVHAARVELKKTRAHIQNFGKELRADAVAYQKKVIEEEKRLVALIEPIEKDLAAKQEAADAEKLRIKRRDVLPARMEKLAAVEAACTEDMILDMDDQAFDAFYNQANAAHLERKEAAIKAEQERREAEMRAESERKEREAAEAQAKKEAEMRAEQERKEAELRAEREKLEADKRAAAEAEAKKQAELKAEEDRLEAEKRRIAKEEEDRRLEAERKAKEEEERKAAEERARQQERERIERERVAAEEAEAKKKAERERLAKYQDFLRANGWTEETKAEYHEVWSGDQLTLYKKVGTLTL